MTDERNDRPRTGLPRWTPPRRPQLPGTTPAPDLSDRSARDTNAPRQARNETVTEPQIVCPHCRTEIKLTQTLAAPLVAETRKQFEQQLAAKESDFLQRETSIKQKQEEIASARQQIEEQVAARLKVERAAISEAEATKARHALAEELGGRDRQLAELRHILAGKDEKLVEAQAAQAVTLRKQRDLDEAKREIDLTVEKRVQDALVAVRDKAKLEVDDTLKTRLSEKEAQIAGMQRQIEDLRRKAEQGSQQLQGEALEIELEARLRARFQSDLIEPVPKGEFGGDVLHRVLGPTGQPCGTILWESKRTKNWIDGWLPKLRDDQRAATADFAMLVTSVLPKGVESFDLVDNVWVVEPRFAIPLAMALRQSLIDIAATRISREGQQTKMELVYQYLTGPRFRHRIEAIVERFTEMQGDLERERKAMTRLWAKRDEQLRTVLDATAGLYGDLQGIAGRAMQEIESLDVFAIEAPPTAASSG
jgi:hypothetical protein